MEGLLRTAKENNRARGTHVLVQRGDSQNHERERVGSTHRLESAQGVRTEIKRAGEEHSHPGE